MANNQIKREELFIRLNTLQDLVNPEITVLPDTSIISMHNEIEHLIARHPEFLKRGTYINPAVKPYQAVLAYQLHAILITGEPLTSARLQHVKDVLGLTGKRADLFTRRKLYIADNEKMSNADLDYIDHFLTITPDTLTNLQSISHIDDYYYTDNQPRVALNTIGLKGVNIFTTIGAGSGNPFPSDISPVYSDDFSAVVSHEVGHSIDASYINGSLLANRKNQLITQAGLTDMQFLRSQVGAEYFQSNKAEFFASICNQWFSSSEHTFELAFSRFNNGYKEPINQALFAADVFSMGKATTRFYSTDVQGNTSLTLIPIQRDNRGHIKRITVKNIIYDFVCDPDGNVLSFGFGNAGNAIDTVAGKCFQSVVSNGNVIPFPVLLGNINVNSNQFTISCWIKPNGLQRIFSPLITYDNGMGLTFSGAGDAPNLELAYYNGSGSWSSGLSAENGAWNFVVLTCSPTGGKIYVNGVPSANTFTVTARDLSQYDFWLTREISTWYSTGYNGAIDEIKFYNYALSQAEVREKMHLIQKYPANENGLLKYFQFNQYNSSTGKVPDVMSAFEATIASANITASTAPVATGKVYRNPNVNAAGLYYFHGAEVLFSLKSGATYPNGEVVAFQLNAAPDQTPGTLPLVPRSKYFIINNYGSNKTFTASEWISFNGLDLTPGYSATDFRLFKRASGAFGATWGNELSRSTTFNYGPGNSNVVFGGDNITTFGQFALTAPAPAATRLSVTTPGEKAIQNGKAIATAEFYPNPNKGWGYLNISSPHDNAHVNVYVQDINGNTLYQASEQFNGSSKNRMLLNLNALTSGVYILQVRFNTGEGITKKVVIVK